MKCWFCEDTARGTCAHEHDEMTTAKSDTCSGYVSYYNVHGAVQHSDCQLESKYYQPGK